MSATRNLIPEIGSIIKAKGKISNFGYLTRNNKTYYTVLLYNVETNNKKIDHLWLVANENFISQNPGKGDTIIFETTIHPYRNRKGIKNLGATRFKLIKIANRQNKLSIKEYIEKVSVAKEGK